jgi:hypothetical protein
VLTEESTQARQMLRRLLRGRWVFLPHLEQRTCEFVGEGDLSKVFRGLINVPKALAFPNGIDYRHSGRIGAPQGCVNPRGPRRTAGTKMPAECVCSRCCCCCCCCCC